MAFAAFHGIGRDRIREVTGLDFEDFSPGQAFSHQPAITVTQQDNIAESLLTQNQARVHFDADFAAATEFGRPLVVSTLTVQRALAMGWKTYGRRRRIVALRRVALTAPVFGGDTLAATSRILAVVPGQQFGLVEAEITLHRQDGPAVGTIHCEMEIWRRGQGPLPALGYTSADDEPVVHRSHVPDPQGRLVETIGLEPAALVPGLVIEHRPGFAFDAIEARARARLAGDHAPLRVDPAVTDAMGVGDIGIGWLTAALTAATTRAFGLVVANLGWENIRILGPINDGTVVFAESEIGDMRPSRSRPGQVILHLRTRGLTRDGHALADFERRLLIWRDHQARQESHERR